MKTTIDGQRYNSSTCERLASYDHYDYSNTYCGTTTLLLAKNGAYLTVTETNGQSLQVRDCLTICDDPKMWLDGVDLDEKEEARLVELGLIEIV